MSNLDDHVGPHIGDHVRVTAPVLELAARGGIPGAVVDVGGGAAPVWLPTAVLDVVERRRR